MKTESLSCERVPLGLFILRLTLGAFLLIWALDKFVNIDAELYIWQNFYHLSVSKSLIHVIGGVELALTIFFILGLWRRFTYCVALIIHVVSTFASYKQLLDPWGIATGQHTNILFVASIPVVGAFLLLYLLRELDTWSCDGCLCRMLGKCV